MIVFSKLLSVEERSKVLNNDYFFKSCIKEFDGNVWIGKDNKGIYCSSTNCNKVKKYL